MWGIETWTKNTKNFCCIVVYPNIYFFFFLGGGGGGEGNSHGKKYVLVVFTLPPFKNNHGDGWLLKLSDYPILFLCESQSQREFFRPTEKVFVQINSILFRKYMNGENRNRDKAGAEKIRPLSQLWARLFFLFVFVSIYDSIFAFDRVWSSRQLEIKVWELSPRARGGLLTITVLKNCYVFLSFWVPFNYFPFPQNANNFSITGKQETSRRRESSATGERTKRERDQRKKACRGNQPSFISTLGTCGKVANYMSLTLDLIVDLKTNKGPM